MTAVKASPAPQRWAIALAGMVALAVAMGIGRFAFTPLLPMMLNDQVITLPRASWLASANYLGYLVGALWCTAHPFVWRRWAWLPPVEGTTLLRGGLAATCLLTLGMALPIPEGWPWLRFAAGVASALVFVHTSGWCLAQLARLQSPALGGIIYTGPGLGIVLSGLMATGMVALHGTAATGWLIFGALAAGLSALVWRVFQPFETPAAHAETPAAQAGLVTGNARQAPAPLPAVPQERAGRLELALLSVAYGLAGFGYIISATFLPVIARAALPGSVWLDLFWPLLGLGVVVGALVSTQMRAERDRRHLLAACYGLQALGIALTLWLPTRLGFALGSLMLGLPFTAITYFAMQEARRLCPEGTAAYIGLMTALYGLGQIAGPPLAAVLIQSQGGASLGAGTGANAGAGFALALEIAASTLVLGALLFMATVRWYPLPQTSRMASSKKTA